MSAKKKEIKQIPVWLAFILVLIAFAAMGMFLVYMFSSGSSDTSSQLDTSFEQSFDTENSVEPPPVEVEVKDTMADANVGDAVIFGRYEQNALYDGVEPLEWIVLEKQEDKILLISRYCIEAMPYNTERQDVSWEDSTLRAVLNDRFLKNAFDENEEKSLITINGDKVSMLSVADAKKYYEYDSWRAASATELASGMGARVEDGFCWWWLIDKGNIANSASYVHFDGTVQEKGFAVDYNLVAVRPIIWVSADAENKTDDVSITDSSVDSSSEISE